MQIDQLNHQASDQKGPLPSRPWWVLAGCAVLVPLALVYGYGFGRPLGGMLLGLATAANTAVLAALLVDGLVDCLPNKWLASGR